MADKEATFFIIDVGRSTGSIRPSDQQTVLEWSLRYVWDKVAQTIAGGRKTVQYGFIAFKTNETSNDLSDDEGFNNISVLQNVRQTHVADVRSLQTAITTSTTDQGDAISAIVLAVNTLSEFLKTQKWKRRIVVVTNASSPLEDNNDTLQIADKIKESAIELVILGPDLKDKAGMGIEQDASIEQNVALLQRLIDECGGVYGTIDQAVAELDIPSVKTKRSVPLYRGTLNLGDPSQYDTAMMIDVERYIKTQTERPPTASSVVEPSNNQSMGDVEQRGDQLTHDRYSTVKLVRQYKVEDDSQPGGKRDVNSDELSRGYEYGRTAVAIAESDESVVKLETKKSLEIVGFIPQESHQHYMDMSRTCVIIAQRANEKAVMALSSFIHTLFETDNYAVARLVTKDGAQPELLLLAPSIEPDCECLIDVVIPFAEDVRPYKFPPLDRINLVSGKVLTVHRNLPSQELQDAMSGYVDAMDLMDLAENEDGNPSEYAAMADVYSPVLHYINQSIRDRAIRGSESLNPPKEHLTKYSNPPSELLDTAAKSLQALQTHADIKKVPPKTFSRRRGMTEQKPRSGIDLSSMLDQRSAANNFHINPKNAIPEFKQLMSRTTSDEQHTSIVQQFQDIIEGWVTQSLGDEAYDRVLEALGILRSMSLEMEEANNFNSFMRRFKDKLLQEALGGDRRELWRAIRMERLTLISASKGVDSDTTDEQAQQFMITR